MISPVETPTAGTGCRRVVDLFSGCGGLSLGFDLLDNGAAFETVLAMDIEQPMLEVLNDNRVHESSAPAGRRVDLEEFESEAEILCFYLDHLESYRPDPGLRSALNRLPGGGLADFRENVAQLDAWYEAGLRKLREDPQYRATLKHVPKDVFTQTSVEAMARTLRLPLLGHRWVDHPVLWWAPETEGLLPLGPSESSEAARTSWRSEVARLTERLSIAKAGSKVHGKIEAWLQLLNEDPFEDLRELWCRWATRRLQLRREFFGEDEVLERLRQLYTADRRVHVILGGPPCQGFSRVGRGKMRSLNDGGVHIHEHGEAGDRRNLLFRKYVEFVSALKPQLFLFENVASFKAQVRTPDGVFNAVEALEEAFEEISSGDVHYAVSSRVLQAAKYGIPQRRSRFFMAGLRHDGRDHDHAAKRASRTLDLPESENEVTLGEAFAGLGSPGVSDSGRRATKLWERSEVRSGRGLTRPAIQYTTFLQSSIDNRAAGWTDAHLARRPRSDDAHWFDLMVPGTRWMDYRCDDSPLLGAIQRALELLGEFVARADRGTWAPRQVEALVQQCGALDLDALTVQVAPRLPMRLIATTVAPAFRATDMKGPRLNWQCSPTLAGLKRAIKALRSIGVEAARNRASLLSALAEVDREELAELERNADGSLSIRILLEALSPPTENSPGHHLLRPVYLTKKSGHHGDWMKRLDPDQPCRTVVSHMAKDTYPYVHPSEPRMLSVREAARVQTFPDAFLFRKVGLFYGFKMIGNAVPPLLSLQLATQARLVLSDEEVRPESRTTGRRKGALTRA